MLGSEDDDTLLALCRKLEICMSEAREQRADLENEDELDTAEVPG